MYDVTVYDCRGMCSHEYCEIFSGDMTADELADANEAGYTVQVHGERDLT